MNEREGRPSPETTPTTESTIPDGGMVLGYYRVPCRVKGCRRDIPNSPGFWPDRTCWKHHRLVAPPVGRAA
jgi:hypothetical protein